MSLQSNRSYEYSDLFLLSNTRSCLIISVNLPFTIPVRLVHSKKIMKRGGKVYVPQ